MVMNVCTQWYLHISVFVDISVRCYGCMYAVVSTCVVSVDICMSTYRCIHAVVLVNSSPTSDKADTCVVGLLHTYAPVYKRIFTFTSSIQSTDRAVIYRCIYTYTYIYICIYIYIYMHTHAQNRTLMQLRYIDACIHTQIYIHTYIHTHTLP